VEHRVRPVRVRLDVGDHADIALSVDVDAERVLRLRLTRVQVAALQDRFDVELDAVVRAAGERDRVALL
jgi:hypothetical protein